MLFCAVICNATLRYAIRCCVVLCDAMPRYAMRCYAIAPVGPPFQRPPPHTHTARPSQLSFLLHAYMHDHIHTHVHAYIHAYVHTHTNNTCADQAAPQKRAEVVGQMRLVHVCEGFLGNLSKARLGPLGGLLGPSWGPPVTSWKLLGASGGPLEAVLKPPGGRFGASFGPLGSLFWTSWGLSGASWGLPEASWGGRLELMVRVPPPGPLLRQS